MFKWWSITKVSLTLICLTLAVISCCNYQFFASHEVSLLDNVFMSLIATVSLAVYALATGSVAIVTGSILIACVKYFIQ